MLCMFITSECNDQRRGPWSGLPDRSVPSAVFMFLDEDRGQRWTPSKTCAVHEGITSLLDIGKSGGPGSPNEPEAQNALDWETDCQGEETPGGTTATFCREIKGCSQQIPSISQFSSFGFGFILYLGNLSVKS